MNVAILTASDRRARGEREDLSGAEIKAIVEGWGGRIVEWLILPDEQGGLEAALSDLCRRPDVQLVLTTGGTGLAARDRTPEATLAVIDRQVPGLAEAMRFAGSSKTPHAMLSRAVCGVCGQTLICNLPGSPKAVRESLEAIAGALPHALALLQGGVTDCGRPPADV